MGRNLFLQVTPPSGGGITINFPTIDWSQLIPQLVSLFFDAIGKWFNTTLHTVFDGLWSGDHNVIGTTPLAMTWAFGPVQGQLADIQNAARAALLFAVILLGLRGMLAAIVQYQPDLLGEFVNGTVGAVILVAAFPLVIPLVIGLVNQAAASVAGGAVISSFLATAGGFSDPLVGGVLFVILLFFAIRLLVKAVWRIGFLAVMLPVGLFACAAYAVPQLRWLLGWWARVWGGMLAAQIPSVFALSVGVGLFLNGGSGIGPFIYSIAFLQLATDMYELLPFGAVRGRAGQWCPVGVTPLACGARHGDGSDDRRGIRSGSGGGQRPCYPTTTSGRPVWLSLKRRAISMGAAITTLFTNLSSQATMPARAIATAVIIGIGLTLTMMPWEHGAVRFLKDSALRVAVGLSIVLNAAAIVATMAGGGG